MLILANELSKTLSIKSFSISYVFLHRRDPLKITVMNMREMKAVSSEIKIISSPDYRKDKLRERA